MEPVLVIPIRRCTVDQLRLQFTKTPHERKSSLQRNHPLNFCFFKLSFHIHRILSLSLEPSPTGDPSIFLTSTRHHLPSHLLLWHIIVHSYTCLPLLILLVDFVSPVAWFHWMVCDVLLLNLYQKQQWLFRNHHPRNILPDATFLHRNQHTFLFYVIILCSPKWLPVNSNFRYISYLPKQNITNAKRTFLNFTCPQFPLS